MVPAMILPAGGGIGVIRWLRLVVPTTLQNCCGDALHCYYVVTDADFGSIAVVMTVLLLMLQLLDPMMMQNNFAHDKDLGAEGGIASVPQVEEVHCLSVLMGTVNSS